MATRVSSGLGAAPPAVYLYLVDGPTLWNEIWRELRIVAHHAIARRLSIAFLRTAFESSRPVLTPRVLVYRGIIVRRDMASDAFLRTSEVRERKPKMSWKMLRCVLGREDGVFGS